jgi:2-furoyl-CoA dehydrogenase 2Fe-2S iron sulfur subunit
MTIQFSRTNDWLSGYLCRCTGYVPIVTAALDAAQQLRETSSNV